LDEDEQDQNKIGNNLSFQKFLNDSKKSRYKNLITTNICLFGCRIFCLLPCIVMVVVFFSVLRVAWKDLTKHLKFF